MNTHSTSRRTFLTTSLLGAAALTPIWTGASPSYAKQRSSGSISDWIERNAVPLRCTAPERPLTELRHLRASIGGAQIVGLGEAAHGTAELTRLKHRVLRYLVEELGFRSIAWEDDWSLGTQLNQYVLEGQGDLHALMGQLSLAWRSEEVAEVFEYLRAYNARHRDKVRFTGVEYFSTRHLAYDAIDDYVARRAPQRLKELRAELAQVTPHLTNMGQYVWWYIKEVPNKAPYIASARKVHELVRSLPHRPGDREHAITLHHARQIISFYEGFSLEDNLAYRDARAAENLRWWHRYSGDKIVYWAASAHTADAPGLTVTAPPPYDGGAFPSVGSYLRRWYGWRYRSIGFTFDHGALTTRTGPVDLLPPRETWFEAPLGEVGLRQFSVELRRPAAGPARAWLNGPLTTRGIPEAGLDSEMSGGSLAQWFDLLIHRQQVSPMHPLPAA